MARRSATTFKKRQKEQARLEKQRDKAAKRVQRKLDKQTRGPGEPDEDIAPADTGDFGEDNGRESR